MGQQLYWKQYLLFIFRSTDHIYQYNFGLGQNLCWSSSTEKNWVSLHNLTRKKTLNKTYKRSYQTLTLKNPHSIHYGWVRKCFGKRSTKSKSFIVLYWENDHFFLFSSLFKIFVVCLACFKWSKDECVCVCLFMEEWVNESIIFKLEKKLEGVEFFSPLKDSLILICFLTKQTKFNNISLSLL